MSEPFTGEIRLFALNFAPKGWAVCNGQLLPINQNQALYSLIGTTYGGDGKTSFALPNLNGRVPVHSGYDEETKQSITLGEAAGEELHVLTMAEMAAHTHFVQASSQNANLVSPENHFWAAKENSYSQVDGIIEHVMHPAALTAVGVSQPHENRQPFLVLNYCIALSGIFPSRY